MVTQEVPVSTTEHRDMCDVCNNEVDDEMTFTDNKNRETIHLHYECFENWRDDYEIPDINAYAKDDADQDMTGGIKYVHTRISPLAMLFICGVFLAAGVAYPVLPAMVMIAMIGLVLVGLFYFVSHKAARYTIDNLP